MDLDPNLEREQRVRGVFPRFINTYREVNTYGGPEEGGWWYPKGEPVGSRLCTSQAELDEKLGELSAKANSLNEDASCGVYYTVRVQAYFAEAYPKHRPTYE